MTVLPLDHVRPYSTADAWDHTPAPVPARSDGLLPVRMVRPPRFDGTAALQPEMGVSEALFDQALLVGYISALARRVAQAVRDGRVARAERRPHPHITRVACLRCAVFGATEHQTLAAALLAILAAENTDEDWNLQPSCSDRQIISRMRKLAVSAEKLAAIYGPRWGSVLLTSLRAESVNLEQLALITRDYDDVYIPMRQYEEREGVALPALASYHLGTITSPRASLRDSDRSAEMTRDQLAKRLAAALARISAGEDVAWVDMLPEPTL